MSDKDLTNHYIKQMYDSSISSEYNNNYEFNRWFVNDRLITDYIMHYKALSFHLSSINFQSCFELGPGPGTWTRLLYRRNPGATFDLLDISQAMKDQFILEMREQRNVEYQVSDIHEFSTDKKYDLFFSSRAIEYIQDTEKLCTKILSLLKPGGKGIIITKNPNHIKSFYRFSASSSKRKQHTGQIKPDDLKQYLERAGASDIKIYPCSVRIPTLDKITLRLSKKFFEKSYTKNYEKLSRLAESYVVTFKKDK